MNETITFEEVGMLLALAAARDQRTTGDADGLAWHADLNAAGITFGDGQAALTRFYSHHMARLRPEDRRRITTPDVISIARKLRAERLENFVYEGDPDETPAQYLARLRAQIEATASGRLHPIGDQPALEGGPHPKVAGALADIGREVPAEDNPVDSVRRAGPLGIDCPACKAPVGQPCRVAVLGKRRRAAHRLRVENARRAAAGMAPVDIDTHQATERQERQRRIEASRRWLAEHPESQTGEAS